MNSISIGVISDTHGLLRPEAFDALRGSNFILHAGDVGDPAILDKLNTIAPVTAVRGNVDHGPWAQAIPETNVLEAGGLSLYMLHNLDTGFKAEGRRILRCDLWTQSQTHSRI